MSADASSPCRIFCRAAQLCTDLVRQAIWRRMQLDGLVRRVIRVAGRDVLKISGVCGYRCRGIDEWQL